jgi:hypothetical protein
LIFVKNLAVGSLGWSSWKLSVVLLTANDFKHVCIFYCS